MKGISLLQGNDARARVIFPRKRTKLNTSIGRDRTNMRENLSRVPDLAWRILSKAQDKMKKRFQRPYTVVHIIYCINYEINAPERRRKTQGCHVNNLENKLAHLKKTPNVQKWNVE